MRPHPNKTLSLTVPLIYSFFLHAAAMGFAMTMPIFKSSTHIESYIVHLEGGQEEAEAEEDVSIAEKLAGKRTRARRMATVKDLKNKERRQAAQLAPKVNRGKEEEGKKETEKQQHWPARPRVEKEVPRSKAHTSAVAKQMHSTEDMRRSEFDIQKDRRKIEPEKDAEPVTEGPEPAPESPEPAPESPEPAQKGPEPAQKDLEPAQKGPEPTQKDLEPAQKGPEPAPKDLEPSKKSIETEKKDEDFQEAVTPKPEEDAEDAAEISPEKPGWQELTPRVREKEEVKKKEDTKESEVEKESEAEKDRQERWRILAEKGGEPFMDEKVALLTREKPVEKIASGMATKELVSDKTRTGDIDITSPAEQLCKDCEPVSMLYENPAGEMILDADWADAAFPEPSTFKASALTEYSPVDGLCDGCSLLSFLRVNPIEEIIYELMNEEKTVVEDKVEDTPTGSAPIIAENLTADVFTKPQQDEDLAGSVHEITEESIAVEAGETHEQTIPEPIIIDVPGVELKTAKRNAVAEHREIAVIRGHNTTENHVEEISTPHDNRTPTKEEYLNVLEIEAARKPEKSEVLVASEAEIGLPIYARKDVEIKVFFRGEEAGASFRLVKKTHPMGVEKFAETDITETLDEIGLTGEAGLRKMFSLSRAGEGAYGFIIKSSNAEIGGIDVEIILNKGLKSEKLKEYNGIKIAPGSIVEFRFLLPEAIFWDDDDYFTGAIEDSRSTTKFNDETGLIWKERTSR